MASKSFSYHHLHHGLTQEKLGSEEGRLALLTPLPTTISNIFVVLFCPPEKSFRNPIHNSNGYGYPDSLFCFLPLPGFP